MTLSVSLNNPQAASSMGLTKPCLIWQRWLDSILVYSQLAERVIEIWLSANVAHVPT